MHANIETDADINANTDANTNVHADILFKSFAREGKPVLPLFGVLPLFVLLLLPAVFPSRGGLTSVRGRGRSSASNLKLKTCPWEWVAPHPFGIASSTPAPAPPSQGWPQRVRGMQGFNNLLLAKTRRGALLQ